MPPFPPPIKIPPIEDCDMDEENKDKPQITKAEAENQVLYICSVWTNTILDDRIPQNSIIVRIKILIGIITFEDLEKKAWGLVKEHYEII